MRYVRRQVMMRTRHHISYQEFTCDTVEALVAGKTGLAIAPINEDKSPGATFATCSQWILMHIESGLHVGKPFPADELFAKTYLEEVNRIEEAHLSRKELDASPARKNALTSQIKSIRQRIEHRFSYHQTTLFDFIEA